MIILNKEIKYIDITLDNMDDASSIYNDDILNEELSDYILKQTMGIFPKQKVIIKIKPLFEINQSEKEKLVDMIRKNYGIDIRESLIRRKYELIKKIILRGGGNVWILMLVGTVFILASELLESNGIMLMPEIFLIISWVAIYEAIYSFIFVDTKEMIKTKRLKKLTNCKIEFI